MSVRWSASLYGVRIRNPTRELHEDPSHVQRHHQHDHPRHAGRPAGQTDRRFQRALHSHRSAAFPRRALTRLWVLDGDSGRPHVRFGMEVVGSAGAHRAPQHQEGALGRGCRGSRCAVGLGREPVVSVLLDAAIRARRPLAVAAARGRVCGYERRSDGGDSRLRRRDLRRQRAAHRQRRRAGAGRLLGVSAPGARGHAGHAPRRHREMGRRAIRAGVRDRRPTAIRVVDGNVEVVSEGHWKLFTPSPEAS